MTVISRSFTTLNKNNDVPLYKTLIRSHLHYATTILVRDPHCKKHLFRDQVDIVYCGNQTFFFYIGE